MSDKNTEKEPNQKPEILDTPKGAGIHALFGHIRVIRPLPFKPFLFVPTCGDEEVPEYEILDDDESGTSEPKTD